MTTTSWQRLLGYGACAALFAAACTVSSGSGDDDEVTTGIGGTHSDGGNGGSTTTGTPTTSAGGMGGSGGSAGDTTTTSSSGGSGGSTTTGGGSGGEPVDCLDDVDGELPGEVVSCETQVDNCCSRCMAVNCCEEYSECFAINPYNICGGSSDEDSEIAVFIDCMLGVGVGDGGPAPGLEEGGDFDTCMAKATEEVSGPYCDNGTISGPTNELGVCLHGDEDGIGGCFEECLNPDFDEAECTYE